MKDLKRISAASIPRALELAERYRLLNEPEQAASICEDVLEVEPDNQQALIALLLALSDAFGGPLRTDYRVAEKVVERLGSPYEKTYYRAVVYERWGRSKLEQGAPKHVAGEWLRRAMELYRQAEPMRPEGDDAALLRWNCCARLMARIPKLMEESQAHELHLGD